MGFLSFLGFKSKENNQSKKSFVRLKKKIKSTLPNKVTINDSENSKEALELHDKLCTKNFQEAETILLQANVENRNTIFNSFSELKNSKSLTEDWIEECPNSAFAHCIYGVILIKEGWKVRGGGYADSTSSAQFERFYEFLQQAEEEFIVVKKLNKELVEPYRWLMVIELGRSGGREIINHYFSIANSLQPNFFSVYYTYFVETTQKWGGSHEEMFEFAESSSKQMPPGSMIHRLIALAFCELALNEGPDYFPKIRNKINCEKITTAFYAWLDATPENVGSKLKLKSENITISGLNEFAVACYLCGANFEAKLLLETLNFEIRTLPWQWIAITNKEAKNPTLAFERVYNFLNQESEYLEQS